jgi:hypothetical protein
MVNPRRKLRSPGWKAPKVRVTRAGQRFEVWLYQFGQRQLTGSLDIRLVSDAGNYGQDLVGDLVEQTLKEADRRSLAL